MLNDGKQTDYALGLFMSTYRGLPFLEHDGANFGYRAGILRFPEQRLTVLCLCNVSTAGYNLRHQVADIYLQGSLKREEGGATSASNTSLPDPAKFAGKYLDPRKHEVYTFTASGGNLMAWAANLRRLGPNRFNDLEAGILTFDDSSGGMKLTLALDDTVFFAGQRMEVLRLGQHALAAYAGQYRIADLDATFDVAVSDGNLVLRRYREPEQKLMPVAPDEFESEDLGNFVFSRGANHRVTGMKLFVDSARGLNFEKTK